MSVPTRALAPAMDEVTRHLQRWDVRGSVDLITVRISVQRCMVFHTPEKKGHRNMPLPTWNGEAVDQGSPRMYEATEQAWDILREALSNARLTDRSAQELLHAVEATAWL